MDKQQNNDFNENKTNTAKNPQQNAGKKPISKSKAADFKRKYFDYYDDVKDHTKGKEDW